MWIRKWFMHNRIRINTIFFSQTTVNVYWLTVKIQNWQFHTYFINMHGKIISMKRVKNENWTLHLTSDASLLFCLIWCFTSQSTIFQSTKVSRIEPIQSRGKSVLFKDTAQCVWWGSNQLHFNLKSCISMGQRLDVSPFPKIILITGHTTDPGEI